MTTSAKPSRRRSAQERHAVVHQWHQSSMSVAACCRKQGVNPASFYAWRRGAEEEQSTPQFVEALIADSSSERLDSARPALARFAAEDGLSMKLMDRSLAVELASVLLSSRVTL